MKIFCISEDEDISLGLRLSGIEYAILKEENEILDKIDELIKNKEYGLIILTDKIYKMIYDKVEEKENKYSFIY